MIHTHPPAWHDENYQIRIQSSSLLQNAAGQSSCTGPESHTNWSPRYSIDKSGEDGIRDTIMAFAIEQKQNSKPSPTT